MNAERLRELLFYDESTGLFFWKKRRAHHVNIGDLAGHVNKHGYCIIVIDGKTWKAHRLAWLYIYGMFPTNVIDHINGNKKDNRIANLRDAPQAINNQNIRKARKDNSTKLQGVSKDRNRFMARISINGLAIHLGCFGTAEEAHTTYIAAKRKLHCGYAA